MNWTCGRHWRDEWLQLASMRAYQAHHRRTDRSDAVCAKYQLCGAYLREASRHSWPRSKDQQCLPGLQRDWVRDAGAAAGEPHAQQAQQLTPATWCGRSLAAMNLSTNTF